MKIKFTTAAHFEFKKAIEYYNSVRDGLGYEFVLEIDKGIKNIEKFDSAWQLLSAGIRRYLIKRFPYGIIYSKDKDTIIVLSIMCLHQKPEKWDKLF